jgi:DNA-binding CsgD family transcriptional regulator
MSPFNGIKQSGGLGNDHNRNASTQRGPVAPDAEVGALSAPQSAVVAHAVEHFARRARAVDRSPRVLLDGHCNVLWQTADAWRLLQPPLPLWIAGGKVHAAGNSGNRTWPSFIENLGEEGERLLLTGKGACSWVLLRGWAARFDDHRLVFLKCALSSPLRDVAGSGLVRDFGLTRSECAVLDEFARMAKPNEIAERLDISISTVRSHLKQIHTKMSVNSSVQLMRITRAYTDA